MAARWSLVLLLGTLVCDTGCAGPRGLGVKPYQRAWLAERCMAPGFGDRGEVKFRAHWEVSRHGLEGGFGTPEGGCGCN